MKLVMVWLADLIFLDHYYSKVFQTLLSNNWHWTFPICTSSKDSVIFSRYNNVKKCQNDNCIWYPINLVLLWLIKRNCVVVVHIRKTAQNVFVTGMHWKEIMDISLTWRKALSFLGECEILVNDIFKPYWILNSIELCMHLFYFFLIIFFLTLAALFSSSHQCSSSSSSIP